MWTLIYLLLLTYGLFLTVGSVRAERAYDAAIEGFLTGAVLVILILR